MVRDLRIQTCWHKAAPLDGDSAKPSEAFHPNGIEGKDGEPPAMRVAADTLYRLGPSPHHAALTGGVSAIGGRPFNCDVQSLNRRFLG